MLYIILITLILLAFLDRALRGGRLRLLRLDLKFRLFALRDELRRGVIDGYIPDNNWFDYLDTTLTRTIDHIKSINPWMAVGYRVIHRKDVALLEAQREREAAFNSPENKKTADIYNKYIEALDGFLTARYPLSFPLAALTGALLTKRDPQTGIHTSVEENKRDIAPVFSNAPETSTLSEFGIPARIRPATDIHVSGPLSMAH